ncbi:uncharacterized protein MELLADRAFT_95361 [Melampsora larici-populina 98AG31]|uniref:Uncharacterized protein n=1 Tax=Melampsora larici-populina (strain 98AG31 / pathotype 3-4-7) TaxID=747676 RepID=F4RD57_MELLP|nr:uncharacterized protein MELLADRAFT_95361 [Melampsora larici-populina 98AG31]EGG09844.1 hypothetical protein MELLADRAFT_95361 [Melampsora larici-populina 98AG31]
MSNSNLLISNLSAVSSQNEANIVASVVTEETAPRPSVNDALGEEPLEASATITTGDDAAATGWMNAFFEPPTPHLMGADAPAHLVDMGPLHRPGTSERDQFNCAHEVVVQVLFKIHTENEVVLTNPDNSTNSTSTKPSTGRRSVGTTINLAWLVSP